MTWEEIRKRTMIESELLTERQKACIDLVENLDPLTFLLGIHNFNIDKVRETLNERKIDMNLFDLAEIADKNIENPEEVLLFLREEYNKMISDEQNEESEEEE